MKNSLISILLSALIYAPSGHSKPAYTLDNLSELCENYEKNSHVTISGNANCASKLHEMLSEMPIQCRAVHKSYEDLHRKAVRLRIKALQWLAQGPKAVTETSNSISISFDITRRPDYPLKNSDQLINKTLEESSRALSVVSQLFYDWRHSHCKNNQLNSEYRRLEDLWYGPREMNFPQTPSAYHNELGLAYSSALLQVHREIRSTTQRQAFSALKKLGIEVKQKTQ